MSRAATKLFSETSFTALKDMQESGSHLEQGTQTDEDLVTRILRLEVENQELIHEKAEQQGIIQFLLLANEDHVTEATKVQAYIHSLMDEKELLEDQLTAAEVEAWQPGKQRALDSRARDQLANRVQFWQDRALEAEKSNEEVTTKLGTAGAEYDDLTKTLKATEDRGNELKSQLSHKVGEVADLKTQLSHSEGQVTNLQGEVAYQEALTKIHNVHHQTAMGDVSFWREHYEEVEDCNARLSGDLKAGKDRERELLSQIDDNKLMLERRQQLDHIHQETLKRCMKEKQTLANDLAAAKAVIQAVKFEIHKLRMENMDIIFQNIDIICQAP
ncbi:MAG: hypothetical protein Q9166_006251 [cf. Caloplaca sp. 2 TL-2023]